MKTKMKYKTKDGRIDLDNMSWKMRKKLKSKTGELKLLRQRRLLDTGAESKIVVVDSERRDATSLNAALRVVPDEQPCHSANKHTVSIALPGSILDNAQSLELRSYLAGQIARAAAIFRVDEIIIFDEFAKLTDREIEAFERGLSYVSVSQQHNKTHSSSSECNFTLARILQFLECPQYLRRRLFPLQNELKFAGLLNPLDCPHHMRADDVSIPYREAIVTAKPPAEGCGSYCDAGFLNKDVQIDRHLEPGVRVTLKFQSMDLDRRKLKATVVSPCLPKDEASIYWGYTVRLVKSLGKIAEDCPYANGYDLVIGTSERGTAVNETVFPTDFRHLLIAFGGLKGLEACVEGDESLDESVNDFFQFYINSCPGQGSRTIRTEEAILITLSALGDKLKTM